MNKLDLHEDNATMTKALLAHHARQNAELRELRKLRDTLRMLVGVAMPAQWVER